MLTRYGEQQYEKYYNIILYNKVLTYCIKMNCIKNK